MWTAAAFDRGLEGTLPLARQESPLDTFQKPSASNLFLKDTIFEQSCTLASLGRRTYLHFDPMPPMGVGPGSSEQSISAVGSWGLLNN